ncbi:MAG: hypothetical protein ACI3WS_02610 [Phascolarctobacterium sp.]
MKRTDKFAYSFDNEVYSCEYDSVEEALADAKQEVKSGQEDAEVVYIGRVYEFEPCVDVDLVIERIQDDAEDETGECADDYLDCVRLADLQKLESMLTETFNKWAAETYNEPNFNIVKEIQEYSLED